MLGAIGAGASAVTGLAQMIAGAVQKKKAEKMAPAMEDPEERAALEAAKQQAKSSYAGTDATTASNMRAINQGARNTQQAISRNTGGDVGSTVSGMLQAQRTAGNQAGQAAAQGAQRGTYFQTAADQLRNRISQRKLELGMQKQQQQMATATNNQQAGFQNLAQGGMGLLGSLPQGTQQLPQLGAEQVETPMANTVSAPMNTPQLQGREPTATGNYGGTNVNMPSMIDFATMNNVTNGSPQF